MIGCDVVKIARVEKILAKSQIKFLKKILTENELKTLGSNSNSIAGYYAAKEAASKALGCGISKDCSFMDIEIIKNNQNRPSILFSEKIFNKFGVKSAHLSISHDAGIAMAVVMLEK